jgi:FAD/FMN-containing dehydrogenase
MDLIREGDPGYDDARQVWNGMISHHPAVIARVESAADVVDALAMAREQGLPVSIRGGGHNVAGLAVGDGALVIDLSAMGHVSVDPVERRAGVGGGARWRDLDTAAQAHGLATPGGVVSDTGVAGLTLSGGSAGCVGSTASAAMPSGEPRWSPPTAGSSTRAGTSTRTCSGACAVAAATSAS